jgi:hypothetical protein
MKDIKIKLALLHFKLVNKLTRLINKVFDWLVEKDNKAADYCLALIDERIKELEDA